MSSVRDVDRGWREIKRLIAELDDTEVVAGLMVGEGGADAELLEYAAANEFGARAGRGRRVTIPERSFIRSTFDENEGAFTEAARRTVRLILDGQRSIHAGMSRLGAFVQAKIQAKIRSNLPPPNAPATIEAKIPRSAKGAKRRRAIAGNKTLIHTGRMLGAVTFVVRPRSSE
jgi:hypothetical protein